MPGVDRCAVADEYTRFDQHPASMRVRGDNIAAPEPGKRADDPLHCRRSSVKDSAIH